MKRSFDFSWWYWLATLGLLAVGVGGWTAGIYLALALCIVQIAHFAWYQSSLTTFPVQVRAAYSGLLVVGLWKPFQFVHWIQLIGTFAVVVVGYCLLARLLSLLPWNRTEPLSLGLLGRTFFQPPVRGSVLQGLSEISYGCECMCSLERPKTDRCGISARKPAAGTPLSDTR
jgi:hypothetical protein